MNGKRIFAGPPIVVIQSLERIQNCHSPAETIGCQTDPGRDRVRRGDTERLTQLIAKFALPGQSCQGLPPRFEPFRSPYELSRRIKVVCHEGHELAVLAHPTVQLTLGNIVTHIFAWGVMKRARGLPVRWRATEAQIAL